MTALCRWLIGGYAAISCPPSSECARFSRLSGNYDEEGERARLGRSDWRPRQSPLGPLQWAHRSVTPEPGGPPSEGAGWKRPGRAWSPFPTAWFRLRLPTYDTGDADVDAHVQNGEQVEDDGHLEGQAAVPGFFEHNDEGRYTDGLDH